MLKRVLQALGDQDCLADLEAFIRIPSISADPAHDDDVRAAATWLATRMQAAGLAARLVETAGHPVVLGSWQGREGAPTVLVYGHYDVQPAALEDGWVQDPFTPWIEDGRIYGRGATDDKGQVLCHLRAFEAWMAHGGPPVNVTFVIEGEEESGSPSFEAFLAAHEDELAADVLVVSDSMMRTDRPAITTSLRGLVYLQVDVQGPRSDLHSGTWGGIVMNPIEALVTMLAACKRDGCVMVPGFYDGVTAPAKAGRERLRGDGESDEDLMDGAGVPCLVGEPGYTGAERIGWRPTFEINGIWGGYTGAGSKTVIPATAHAKVSCRLVSGQDEKDIAAKVKRHLMTVAPPGVTVAVRVLDDGPAMVADASHPFVQVAAAALQDAFGAPPALLPEGGTIPPVAALVARLGVVPVLAGFGMRDENQHAPQESFRLSSYEKGAEAAARMFAAFATVERH